ncbi:YfjI family protein [Roseobacter sp. EG26]|uniref:YfjI family protein n=1 Tax=Roseobacter sp. EG26 TaxID=3412477 RepID=UPI003CE52500
MTVIQPQPFVSEGPQPLVREIPQGEAYPVHALGPLREAVEAVQRATQAPVAIAAQSALSVASLAVQGHADVETLAGYAPISLFCLTVAQSGERKSGCDKLVMFGLRDIERGRAADYREAMADWDVSNKLWSAKRDRFIKEASGKNVATASKAEADLSALGPAPAQPTSPKMTTSEPTLEGLVKLYLTGQPSLGLFSDEGGGFLGGHAMNSDNRLKTVAGLSGLWGGDALDRVRAGDGATTLYGRRLAAHLMVQPVAARPLLSDPIASGQGFLARFLITEPPSAIGTRLATNAGAESEAIVAMSARLSTVLSASLPTCEGNPQELDPRQLRLSSEAKRLLIGYYQATERAQAPGGDLEQVKSFASKSPEQAARIAGVLALWSDLGGHEVTAEQMTDAIELAQFYLGEAKRLSEAATVSEEVDKAEKLRRWLLDSWPTIATNNNRDPSNIVPRDVVYHGPGSLRETATARKLMAVLAAYGWLMQLDTGAVVDGKSRQIAYRIVRPA